MKKILILVIVSLASLSVFSQNMKFTVFVDPKFAWMTSDIKSVERDGSKFGVNIGLNVDNFFADNYALMTGVSIDNTGGKLIFDSDKTLNTKSSEDTVPIPAGRTIKYNLQYINIPLGLKFKTNEIGYLTFYTHLGINGGINIKATAKIDDFELENENISEEIKLFDLGYYIGAGVEYSIGGNSAIVLGITYTNGFIDITTDSSDKVTLRNFAIRIGVLF